MTPGAASARRLRAGGLLVASGLLALAPAFALLLGDGRMAAFFAGWGVAVAVLALAAGPLLARPPEGGGGGPGHAPPEDPPPPPWWPDFERAFRAEAQRRDRRLTAAGPRA